MSLLLLFNKSLPWHKALLETAERLRLEGQPEVAVVSPR